MKKIILNTTQLFLFTLLSFGVLNSQTSNEITIPFSNPGSDGIVNVYLKSGTIHLKGTNRTDVLLRYEEIIDDEEDNDKKETTANGLKKISANNIDLQAYEKDNEVTIKSNSWHKALKLTIEVPSNVDIDVENYMGGDIDISNIKGESNIESYTGSIKATNLGDAASASAYAGNITITFDGLGGNDHPMSFKSYSGNVDITFPPALAANFKMRTSWGEIFSDLDLKVDQSKAKLITDDDSESYKVYTDSWTYATVGGGGIDIDIKTQSGNIYLRGNN